MAEPHPVHTVADYLTLWLSADAAAPRLKTRDTHGDPVEFGEKDVADLTAILQAFLVQMR
ncbi:hypothetical protein VPG91_05810 [Nitrospirillum amazonense]|uniref:hypothetical protein n=1 Tax=Nitrospirillum amazonense TaxID=28077 RepID=UPI002DD42716|nr:hypothetical protein [Nitrospirillum amazonense]MEC4590494.1 hypothetical protein [Nitrospirillum amazonense]